MAMHSTDLHHDSYLTQLGHVFSSIGNALIGSSHAYSRMQKVRELNAKSDEELADMGIRRDGIVNHVYQDVMYL